MPLVTVTAPPHPEQHLLLGAAADAVAQALALGDGDVLATWVAASAIVASGATPGDAPGGAWPIVSIHGGDRGAEAVDAACAAAERAVRDWAHRNSIDLEGVWTEWLPPRPMR